MGNTHLFLNHMAVHARSDFALAINQVCEERNISVEAVLDTIKNAILAAFRKEKHAAGEGVNMDLFLAEINPETGETRVFEKKEDGTKGADVTPPGFGRIAAQTAKQVILQKIREAEKQAVLTDYSTKIGSLVNGLILRFDRANVIVDIGKTEAVMPLSEQVRDEKYRVNQRLVFYLVGIRETPKGNQIIVSRADKGLIEGLFRREIPEVQNGTVKIKEIAREPGVRTKVAVWTDKSGVDPIGACVGQKGVRVQAILKELISSERIDLVLFTEDVVEYIRSALAPAKNLRIVIDEMNKIARVYAPEDQLSLAIGAKGANVGLAARMTGYKIDILSSEEKPEIDKTEVTEAEGVEAVAGKTENGKQKTGKVKKGAKQKLDEEVGDERLEKKEENKQTTEKAEEQKVKQSKKAKKVRREKTEKVEKNRGKA